MFNAADNEYSAILKKHMYLYSYTYSKNTLLKYHLTVKPCYISAL